MAVTLKFNKAVAADAEGGNYDSPSLKPVAAIFAEFGAKPVSVYGSGANSSGVFVINNLTPAQDAQIVRRLQEQGQIIDRAYVPGRRA